MYTLISEITTAANSGCGFTPGASQPSDPPTPATASASHPSTLSPFSTNGEPLTRDEYRSLLYVESLHLNSFNLTQSSRLGIKKKAPLQAACNANSVTYKKSANLEDLRESLIRHWWVIFSTSSRVSNIPYVGLNMLTQLIRPHRSLSMNHLHMTYS
jgi:hypothetical protein